REIPLSVNNLGSIRSDFSSPMKISPCCRGISPYSDLINVDFPAPLCPIRQRTSFLRSSKLKCSRTGRPPYPTVKSIVFIIVSVTLLCLRSKLLSDGGLSERPQVLHLPSVCPDPEKQCDQKYRKQ